MSVNNIALLFLCNFVSITDSYHLKAYSILLDFQYEIVMEHPLVSLKCTLA